MIKPLIRKKNINNAVAVQNLIFEQKLDYKSNSEKQSLLVNKLYDLQHWHYFYGQDLDFKGKIDYLTRLFGKYSIKKKMPQKGDTYIWFVEINSQVYSVYQCSYACFVEVALERNYDQVLVDVDLLMTSLFSNCNHFPKYKK